MDKYAQYVDILGVSADSFIPATNASIGRGGDANNNHHLCVLKVREMCDKHDVLFKINTVVNRLNMGEDMNVQIKKLDPYRWKVFQVLLLEGENAGGSSIRDARDLTVTTQEFDNFILRHEEQAMIIPKPNAIMQNSGVAGVEFLESDIWSWCIFILVWPSEQPLSNGGGEFAVKGDG